MGSWAPAVLLSVLFLFSATGALAFHDDPPLRHRETLSGPGWFAARFTPGVANVTVTIAAVQSGPAFHKIVLFDDEDRVLGSWDVYRGDHSAYARASAAHVRQEVRVPVMGGGWSGGSGTPFPCGLWYISSWSSNGEQGSGLQIPPSCGGRPVRGALAFVAGVSASQARFEIRSWEPVAVHASVAERGAQLVGASRFNGTSVEVVAPLPFVDPAIGISNASAARNIQRGLIGTFDVVRGIGPQQEGELAYEHDGVGGACPCTWNGGPETQGKWSLTLRGVRTTQAYFAYADAALPAASS